MLPELSTSADKADVVPRIPEALVVDRVEEEIEHRTHRPHFRASSLVFVPVEMNFDRRHSTFLEDDLEVRLDLDNDVVEADLLASDAVAVEGDFRMAEGRRSTRLACAAADEAAARVRMVAAR